MTDARNLWVDYAKGIGIVLVVYGHVARGVFNAGLVVDKQTYELIDSVIYSFHMPLFFFLSGLFFIQTLQKYKAVGLVRNKLATVIYPYVVWSVIQGLFEVVLSRYTNGHVTLTEVFSLFWAPRAQFWFLYVLFFVFVVGALVYRRVGLGWVLGGLVASLLFYFVGVLVSAGYLVAMVSHYFVFFALGIWFASWGSRFESGKLSLVVLLGAVFFAAQWLLHADGVPSNIFYQSLTSFVPAVLGIAWVVVLAGYFVRLNWQWLATLGRFSMAIYLVHILAGSGCRVVLQKMLGVTDLSLHLFLGTLAGLLLPILFYQVCMQFKLSFLFAVPRVRTIAA